MKITPITIHKSFKRVLTDGNYGSLAFGTEITSTVEIDTRVDLVNANKLLYEQVTALTLLDIDKYNTAKKDKKVV